MRLAMTGGFSAMTEECHASTVPIVMRGLDPRIHSLSLGKTWMAGSSPAMTRLGVSRPGRDAPRNDGVGQPSPGVMRGLDPRIHFLSLSKTWMAGSSPAMTELVSLVAERAAPRPGHGRVISSHASNKKGASIARAF
jgi:hypothetical protein